MPAGKEAEMERMVATLRTALLEAAYKYVGLRFILRLMVSSVVKTPLNSASKVGAEPSCPSAAFSVCDGAQLPSLLPGHAFALTLLKCLAALQHHLRLDYFGNEQSAAAGFAREVQKSNFAR